MVPLLQPVHLLPGVELELGFLVQKCLLVAHITHALNESFQCGLDLRQTRPVLLVKQINQLGPVLLVHFPLQDLVLGFRETQSVIELLILVLHLHPHEL